MYHIFFAIVLPALGKIDEAESTSQGPHYIPRFEVSVHYSDTMKVLSQLVYLGSAGNHLSAISSI